jgi:hypothetical protein
MKVIRYLGSKLSFVAANIAVMYVLHGNSRQFWPKIPYLSLRNESIPEHSRLLFNTLVIVTLGQVALKRMPRSRLPARCVTIGLLPTLLPLMIGFGHRRLHLQGHHAEIYNIALVPVLPVVTAVIEDGVVTIIERDTEST